MGAALVAFAGCARNELSLSEPRDEAGRSGREHLYGMRATPADAAVTRGVATRDKLWAPGKVISVKFLNGTADDRQLVRECAAEWERHADITFNFIESGNAEVRIEFDPEADVTWSYTGTDCKYIRRQADPTVFIGGWAYKYEEEQRGDALRALGQVLGLELEHRHSEVGILFRENRLEEYWETYLPYIDWEDFLEFVVTPLSESEWDYDVVETADYDSESIMVWPFTSRYATTPLRTENYELSAQDIEFIDQLYPLPIVELMEVQFDGYPNMSLKLNKKVTVVFDYGKTIILSESNPDYYEDGWGWVYDMDWDSESWDGSPVVAKIYGVADAVSEIEYDWNTISLSINDYAEVKSIINTTHNLLSCLNVAGNQHIETIDFALAEWLPSLDLQGMTSLKTLRLISCDILSELILPDNAPLESIILDYSPLLSLDLSNAASLKCLKLAGLNNITSLDLSGSPALESLELSWMPLLSSLNISANPNLTDIWIYECPLLSGY